MSDHVVDKADLASALRVLNHDRNDPPMATCPVDNEPLVATFRYSGAEFVCVVCGQLYGFLSPKAAKPTPELEARYQELKARFEAPEWVRPS